MLPGTGFMGLAAPADTNKDARTYIHGSAVDVQAYYKTLEASAKFVARHGRFVIDIAG